VETEEVDVDEITFDCWWEVVLVDLVEDKVEVGGTDGMLALMTAMKMSMESALTPAPLWRLACHIVVQMSPGRA
jgi:hypothetical protein